MKHWGHVIDDDNKALDIVASRFKKRVRLLKKPDLIEAEIRRFMKAYMAIGEDPTDTVIRDNVWAFLQSTTRGKLHEDELDRVWRSEAEDKRTCVVS